MRIEARPYQPEDFEQLIALYKDKTTYGGKHDPERDTADRLQQTGEQGNLVVAVRDGEVVGSSMILDNPHSFWLLRFVVKDNDAEVAQVISNYVCKLANERGHESVIVYTDPEDEELNQRYQDLGYTQASTYRCYWKEPK